MVVYFCIYESVSIAVLYNRIGLLAKKRSRFQFCANVTTFSIEMHLGVFSFCFCTYHNRFRGENCLGYETQVWDTSRNIFRNDFLKQNNDFEIFDSRL